jgi:hypothetical protein
MKLLAASNLNETADCSDRILEQTFPASDPPVGPSDWTHAMRMQLKNGSSHHHQQPTYKQERQTKT